MKFRTYIRLDDIPCYGDSLQDTIEEGLEEVFLAARELLEWYEGDLGWRLTFDGDEAILEVFRV